MRRHESRMGHGSNGLGAGLKPLASRRRQRSSACATGVLALCAILASLMCVPGMALADVNEHAYALHMSGVGSSGDQVTVDEGSAFVVELLVSVETALADEDEADDELDALAAFVACDSGGRVLRVSGVTWLPDGSDGYHWSDFNDDAAIGLGQEGRDR